MENREPSRRRLDAALLGDAQRSARLGSRLFGPLRSPAAENDGLDIAGRSPPLDPHARLSANPAMTRTVILWALGLAAGAFVLQWLQYRWVVHAVPGQVYVALIAAAFLAATTQDVYPAYRSLRAYLADQYLPAARESVGLSAIPGGAALYRLLVRAETTLDCDPDTVHRTGLAEVARIHEVKVLPSTLPGWSSLRNNCTCSATQR